MNSNKPVQFLSEVLTLNQDKKISWRSWRIQKTAYKPAKNITQVELKEDEGCNELKNLGLNDQSHYYYYNDNCKHIHYARVIKQKDVKILDNLDTCFENQCLFDLSYVYPAKV